MSARSAIGASARADLFQKEGIVSDEAKGGDFSPNRQQRVAGDAYGLENDADSDPLQLDHMLGYSDKYSTTLTTHPRDESIFIKSMGGLVVVGDLNNIHTQMFLRGHDMQVTTLATSPSGRYLASGQKGTVHFRGYAAPIFLWDLTTGERVSVLRGITESVTALSFSEDEKFLCGCGADSLVYIWDLHTGEVVFGTRLATPAHVVSWVDTTTHHGRKSYELALGIGSHLVKAIFSFEQLRVQWQLKLEPYNMPVQGGLVRNFTDMALSPDKRYLYVGTVQGEMMIFRRDTYVFRALIPVCSAGLSGVAVRQNGDVVCGGGDGTVKRLTGEDMEWRVVMESRLPVGVHSLRLAANDAEAILGTSDGSVYRILLETMADSVVSQAHTGPVTCIAFDSRDASVFITGTSTASLRVWEVADYACLAELSQPKFGAVMSVGLLADRSVISGWGDGNIRCFDQTLQRMKWVIPGAHRGGVSSIAIHQDNNLSFMVTGGVDGGVRVWKTETREFIAEYTDHARAVTRVLVDVKSPNLIHSCSQDSTVISYDIKSLRRVQTHTVNSGLMLDMTQRLDSETELMTCDNQGRLLYWDVDQRDPVLAVQDPTRASLTACQTSPSGRYLAFAGEDTLIKVMDVRTGSVLSLGQGHSAAVRCLHWTPDERQIITGGEDTCLCVWNFFLGGDDDGGEEKQYK